MTEAISGYRLNLLVLALIARKESMRGLIEKGFTAGQIMRALLEAQKSGLVAEELGRTVLTRAGIEAVQAVNFTRPKEKWIHPLFEEKINPIEITDVWLPDGKDSFE